MNYLIDPKIFYLMSVLSSLEMLLISIGALLLISTGIATITYFVNLSTISSFPRNSEPEKRVNEEIKKIFKPLKIIMILIILLGIPVLIPSKETMVQMLVASQVTSENYEIAKDEVVDLIDYIIEKIEGEEE